jgi:hypothetical protein
MFRYVEDSCPQRAQRYESEPKTAKVKQPLPPFWPQKDDFLKKIPKKVWWQRKSAYLCSPFEKQRTQK